MNIKASTPDEYLDALPEDRVIPMTKLRDTIVKNIPSGFLETMSYGMIGYVVPHAIYPAGYHCDPKLPLPFINIASQKNYIALYHSCIYTSTELMNWFAQEYPKHSRTKLDMGKSCIRFKKVNELPLELIAQLVSKVSVEDWIKSYEANIKSK